MGFFSQLCAYCEKSIISQHACNKTNDWMTQARVITPYGDIFRGEYDGYGRLLLGDGSEVDGAVGFENEVYHARCWAQAGSPTVFTKASAHAPDQGFFFDDDEMNFASPDEARNAENIPSVWDRMKAEDDDEFGPDPDFEDEDGGFIEPDSPLDSLR